LPAQIKKINEIICYIHSSHSRGHFWKHRERVELYVVVKDTDKPFPKTGKAFFNLKTE